MEDHVGNTALEVRYLRSFGYELSVGTSVAKVSRDGCIVFHV